jgi:hypothetical protein
MIQNLRWFEAQKAERHFWDEVVQDDSMILRVLADNAEKAPQVQNIIAGHPTTCLEVGVGPFGVGIIGFLPDIEHRFAVDPLPPILLIR